MLLYEFLIYFHFYALFLKVLLKREIVIEAVLKYFQYILIMTFFFQPFKISILISS